MRKRLMFFNKRNLVWGNAKYQDQCNVGFAKKRLIVLDWAPSFDNLLVHSSSPYTTFKEGVSIRLCF